MIQLGKSGLAEALRPVAPPPFLATKAQGPEMVWDALRDGEFRLKRPLTLLVDVSGGTARITWGPADITTRGANLGVALELFRAAIIRAATAGDARLANFVERRSEKA